MRKNSRTAILILTLIITSSLSSAAANPAPLFPFPWDNPNTTPPTIKVYSPSQGASYDDANICLDISVVKPDTWFPNASIWDASYRNAVFGNITAVYYIVDGGERQDFEVFDVDSLFKACSTYSLNYTTNLNVTSGRHSVIIGVEANSYYVLSTSYAVVSYPLRANTTIDFNVGYIENPTNTPVESTPEDTTPTSIIAAAQTQDTTIMLTALCVAVAVTCLGGLAFLRRRKHQ